MLVIHKNDVVLDGLDDEDKQFLDGLDDEACVEILEGDFSLQRTLGEVYELKQLATFEKGDQFISSYVDKSKVPFPFNESPGYYEGETVYTCIQSTEHSTKL